MSSEWWTVDDSGEKWPFAEVNSFTALKNLLLSPYLILNAFYIGLYKLFMAIYVSLSK